MTTIRLRRDTTTRWETHNPVLDPGEKAVDTVTGFEYTGDGVTNWLDLEPTSIPFATRGGRLRDEVLEASLPFLIADSAYTTLADVYAAAAALIADGAPAVGVVAKGTFTLTSALSIPSNTISDWTAAVILRGYSVTPPSTYTKYVGAMIRQAGTSAENITIRGGFVDVNGHTGAVVALQGVTNLTFLDTQIDYTGAGDWAVTISGSRVEVSNVKPIGGEDVFEDGIHVLPPSDGVTINGGHVESGDDMVAIGLADDVILGDVRNVTVNGVTGSSQSGHLFRLDIPNDDSTGTIENITFGIAAADAGLIANGGILLNNASTDITRMRHITLVGAIASTDATSHGATNPFGLRALCVYDLDLIGLHVYGNLSDQLYLEDCDEVRVRGGMYGPPHTTPDATPYIIYCVDCGRVSIDTTTDSGSETNAFPVRLSGVTRAEVKVRTLNIPNGLTSVFCENACGTLVMDGCSGTTSGTARGLNFGSSGLTTLIWGPNNDFSNLANDVTDTANTPTDLRIAYTTKMATVELVSDILQAFPFATNNVQVEGQSGSADNLATIRHGGNFTAAKGEAIYIYRGGEDITVKHGTGNIKTATAADVTMTSTANTVLHFKYDGSNWIEIG